MENKVIFNYSIQYTTKSDPDFLRIERFKKHLDLQTRVEQLIKNNTIEELFINQVKQHIEFLKIKWFID